MLDSFRNHLLNMFLELVLKCFGVLLQMKDICFIFSLTTALMDTLQSVSWDDYPQVISATHSHVTSKQQK